MQATDGLTIMLSTVAAFNQDGDNLKIHQKYGDVTRWDMLGGKTSDGRVRRCTSSMTRATEQLSTSFKNCANSTPKAFILASASPLPEDLADLLSGKTPEKRRESLAARTVAVSTKEVVRAGLLKNRLYFIDCNTAKADAIREANKNGKISRLSYARSVEHQSLAFIVNKTARGVDIWEQLVQLGVHSSKIAVHLNGARDVIFDRQGTASSLIDTYSGKRTQDRSPEALVSAGYTHIIWNLTLREGWGRAHGLCHRSFFQSGIILIG